MEKSTTKRGNSRSSRDFTSLVTFVKNFRIGIDILKRDHVVHGEIVIQVHLRILVEKFEIKCQMKFQIFQNENFNFQIQREIEIWEFQCEFCWSSWNYYQEGCNWNTKCEIQISNLDGNFNFQSQIDIEILEIIFLYFYICPHLRFNLEVYIPNLKSQIQIAKNL